MIIWSFALAVYLQVYFPPQQVQLNQVGIKNISMFLVDLEQFIPGAFSAQLTTFISYPE